MSSEDFEEDSPHAGKGTGTCTEDLLDDLVSQITSKLGIQDSRDAQVAVFMEVLQCTMQEAEFFLDSTNGDIASAVELCIEANGEYNSGDKRRRGDRTGFSGGGDSNFQRGVFAAPMYTGREVNIQGLDAAWIARVSRHSGRIVFRHVESGYEQHEVPPGFDDAPAGIVPELQHGLTNEEAMTRSFRAIGSDGNPFAVPTYRSSPLGVCDTNDLSATGRHDNFGVGNESNAFTSVQGTALSTPFNFPSGMPQQQQPQQQHFLGVFHQQDALQESDMLTTEDDNNS
jgi:hypothetical protein